MAVQSVTLILSHLFTTCGLGFQEGSGRKSSLGIPQVLSDTYWSFYLHPDCMFQVTGLADRWCQLLAGSSAEAVGQGVHVCLFTWPACLSTGANFTWGPPQRNDQKASFCETEAKHQDFLCSVLGVHAASWTASVICWAEETGTHLSLEVHLRIRTIFNPPEHLSVSPTCEDWGSQPELTRRGPCYQGASDLRPSLLTRCVTWKSDLTSLTSSFITCKSGDNTHWALGLDEEMHMDPTSTSALTSQPQEAATEQGPRDNHSSAASNLLSSQALELGPHDWGVRKRASLSLSFSSILFFFQMCWLLLFQGGQLRNPSITLGPSRTPLSWSSLVSSKLNPHFSWSKGK